MQRLHWIAGLLVATACARAEPPALSPASLPFAIDTLRTERVRDGVAHHFIYSAAGPWAIHVLDVRLDQCHAPLAVKGAPGAGGRTKTSELLRALSRSRDVVGGVNADFFLSDPAGVPTGAHVSGWRVITPPSRQPVFAVDSAGRARIVVLSRADGDTTAIPVDDPALARLSLRPFHPREAVGGRPVLARDSALSRAVLTGSTPFATARHPRTAVGIARGGRRLLLVTVDGRQAGYSAGMSLRELADLMLALGAPDALNLDGGGSTTLVVADSVRGVRIANRPSDEAGERAVGNALAVVRDCSLAPRY